MPELIHCRVRGCGKIIHAKNFEDGMAKLRHHYKHSHLKIFQGWGKKAAKTKRGKLNK